MARMYKSRRGKSGSSKPYVTEAPEWSNTNSDEVTNLVLDLGKSGHSTAEIGTILRDQHAVPDVRLVTGKRIGAILAENDIGGTYPEDMMNLMRQAARIIEHLGSGNHKDLHNKILESLRPRSENTKYYMSKENYLQTGDKER